jgi:hypothetical protein
MKENILKLRSEGKSYRQIEEILGCSRATISFHCGKGQKQKTYTRKAEARKKFRILLRKEAGGRCSICGYDKCIDALDFHHPNDDKDGEVSDLLTQRGYKAAKMEAEKCKLICANCHREIHSEMVREARVERAIFTT